MTRPLTIRRAVQRYRALPWTPLNLGSALVAWWDPTQGLTMNGSNVASWTDRVAGIVASQSTVSAQPSYSVTARNGKPGLTFNGSQRLDFTPTSAFPVNDTQGGIAIAAYPTGESGESSYFFYGPPNTNSFQSRYLGVSSNDQVQAGASGGGSNSVAGEVWLGIDRFVITEFGPNNTVSLNVDGNPTETGNIYSNIQTVAQVGSIGAWRYYGRYLVGVGQQFMVYTGLTTSQRQKLEGWESWTDGKAGANLPASHPYKSRAPYVSDP